MKYVMLRCRMGAPDSSTVKLIPVIFPDFMVHEDMATAVKTILSHQHKMETEIHSAGDVELIGAECSGGSETLKVDSLDDDSRVIRTYDYMHGMCVLGEE